jgi:hypothetical protein
MSMSVSPATAIRSSSPSGRSGRGAAPARASCPAQAGARYWHLAYCWDLAWLTAVMMDCALPWPAK